MKCKHWLLGLVAGTALAVSPVCAEVKPHALFTEHMVLQRDMDVTVWGTAADGETVKVSIQGQEASATPANGTWKVTLKPLQAGGPFTLTIEGSNKIELKDVLVGEVWVCSGQSNMEWPVSASHEAQKVIAGSANPNVRLFTVPHRPASAPIGTVASKWAQCGPQTIPGFTAVGYFFGRDLQKALNVPVGLINTSWGGTPAESWTSTQALDADASLKYLADNKRRALQDYAKQLERYSESLSKYQQRVAEIVASGGDLPDEPKLPASPARNAWVPSTLYNGMIAPLLNYKVRGAIWYQGESNAGRAYEYRTLMPTMIQNWRKDWNSGDFPFFMVQLAPFMKINEQPMDSNWAELREAQLLTTQKLSKTGMAVITDVGEEFDIHPKKKEPVGARLALAARALAYGEKIVYSGPEYTSQQIEGDKIVLSFKHVGSGLVCQGEKLTGFTIAGKDGKFVNAQAEIQGDKVVVRSPDVTQPVAVRFGWANYPVVNLWNKEGLPSSPFRTDEFPLTTAPKRTAVSTAQ